ncbi:hypothetical protein B7P43_G03092, partial [Cryptotermes secundus]
FYGDDLLAPHPTPKLEAHPLSAVRDCLFNIFAASLQMLQTNSGMGSRTIRCCLDTGSNVKQPTKEDTPDFNTEAEHVD